MQIFTVLSFIAKELHPLGLLTSVTELCNKLLII